MTRNIPRHKAWDIDRFQRPNHIKEYEGNPSMSKKDTQVIKEVPVEPTPKVTGRWGTSEAKWLMDREDEEVILHMREGFDLNGYLVGVDNYSVFIERKSDKKVLLVPKHAINYAEGV